MKYLLILSSSLLFLMLGTNVEATNGVVINEVFPNPLGSSETDEWVELYNNSSLEIDLSGWQLDDIAGGGSSPYTIPADTQIQPHGFLIFDKAITGITLNNSSETVRLINKEGVEADTFKYTSTQEGLSYARSPNGTGGWIVTSPTKGSVNPKPPSRKSGKIILSEFLPNPEEGQEWVEVYNPNKFTLDISGWKIDDVPEGSSPFVVPNNSKIAKGSYKVFYLPNKLNNSGDTLRLIKPAGKVVETYKYPSLDKETVFAKNSKGTWQETTTPTPGKNNKITQPLSDSEVNDPDLTLESTGLSSSGLTEVPDILGFQDPNSFTESANADSATEPQIIAGTKDTKYSPSTILIGLGLILLGIAVGLPALKNGRKYY